MWRRYDAPRTPPERVQRCAEVDRTAVARLVALRDALDPFVLAAAIALGDTLTPLWRPARAASRMKGTGTG